jgi:IMP dehydrogenase
MRKALSFDDVLLIPQHSNIVSRKDVDVSTKLSKHLTLKIPIISSCMDTVTGPEMAIAMWKSGGLGILHRYNSIVQQCQMLREVHAAKVDCAIAIGITGDFKDRLKSLVELGGTSFCFDVAHGDCDMMEDAIKWLRTTFGRDFTVIAGNVATGIGAMRLMDAGADAIRIGIGGGSLCTTRLMTGHGIPTFQSVLDCWDYLSYHRYNKSICLIADGGIKNSGDIVKSVAAGAGAVILGQLLASTDEAPGELIDTPHGKFKKYRGMSSFGAQVDWRPEKKDEIVPEGEDTILPYKGSVEKILYQLIGGVRSGMTYSNARTLNELKKNIEFVQITSAGWAESKPHAKVE